MSSADRMPDAVEPIAVIGMAARVPGAADIEEFWKNLLDGVESVSRFDRAEQLARGVAAEDLDDPSWVSAAPMLDRFDHFDAELFGMTSNEALLTDPQHRLMLELAHAALENAGYDPSRDEAEIGLFCGAGGNLYQWEYLATNRQLWEAQAGSLAIAVGNSPSYLATMASYKLNLRGPSMAVHTACSTSLVAIHLACESLRAGECDAVLAGGVSVELPHGVGYRGSDGFLSEDGHCRPFDAAASGTLWGSGAGVVMLKRLADAIADGDTIRAVVLGSAVNNDGTAKVGFSAPSVAGQARVVANALDAAAVDARTIGYVEAHGTGTALGDPIEVRALARAYGQFSRETQWCGLGTVKSNIGHLSQAAGVIGFIKAALAVERGLIPPTINIDNPTPAIDFESTPFRLITSVAAWPVQSGPRRAAVSSFGIGGTNAHAILQEPPVSAPQRSPRPAHLLRLSAASPEALHDAAYKLAAHLGGPGAGTDLADVAYTLSVGRAEHQHRTFVVAADGASAANALRDRKRLRPTIASGQTKVAFLLSGQGAQYAAMGAELYRLEPAFAAGVDECARLLDASLGADLRPVMFGETTQAQETLRQTSFAQPALFTIEYALARLWQAWGVMPAALLGHSIGEYVAATLAGVFSLEDALRLVAARGRLMQQLAPGSMLAVQLEEAELAELLPADLSIAAVNGPRACVVSGPTETIAAFADKLKAGDVGSRPLRTSHAFHSAMTEPIVDTFAELVAATPRHAPAIPFASNVTGDWITEAQAVDPAYWAGHIRQAVRFSDGLRTLLSGAPGDSGAVQLLLECGPGRQLAGLARLQTGRDNPATAALHSLPGLGERVGDLAVMGEAAGAMWAAGVPVAGHAAGGGLGRRIPLPGYAYQRKRYWVEQTREGRQAAPATPKADGLLPLERWFAAPVWRQLSPVSPLPIPATGSVVVLSAGPGGESLAAALQTTAVVRAGDSFDMADPAAYDRLVAGLPTGIDTLLVHAMALDASPTAEKALQQGYFSAVRLVQAVAAAGATKRVRLVLVSRNTEDVLGGDLTAPEHATLAGISRVAPLELPDLAVRRIDVDQTVPWPVLAAELARDDVPEVALRGNRRWVREFEQLTLPGGESRLRDGGRYLITGGLGGIGLTIAEDLAVRHRAQLVLIGRNPLSDTNLVAVEAIRRMEAAGARVLTLTADVTSLEDLSRVRQAACDTFGGLDAIVHAAGIAGGAMLEVADPQAAKAVLAPKVAGTLALREVFGDLDLDFVALCSSVTSIVGALGQADYCAANAFLDAFARSEHGWRTRVVSLNWGGWSEVGMAAASQAWPALAALRELGEPGEPGEPMAHPMLTTRAAGECSGVLSPATHWLLDEHRIGGVAVVPGTAHLEAARAAVAALYASPGDGWVLELSDVTFVRPVRAPEGEQVHYRVEVTVNDGAEFSVHDGHSGAAAVFGHARWVPAGVQVFDTESALARCAAVESARHSHSGLLEFGPRWAALAEHRVGAGEELALLRAPQAALADLRRWVLHPALLDLATSFGRGESTAPTGSYLPLSYGRVVVHAPLPAEFYSHLRHRSAAGAEVLSADLTLSDPQGRVLVEIEDFVLRRVDAASVAQAPPPPAPAAAPRDSMTPAQGAEVFRRALTADAGPQLVLHPRKVEDIRHRLVSVTDDEPAAVQETGDGPPMSELESVIAQTWRRVLGVEVLDVDDDFFALGGNSLVAVQLIAQTRKATGVRVPMRSLFDTPTVAGLAAVAARLRETGQAQASAEAATTTIPRQAR